MGDTVMPSHPMERLLRPKSLLGTMSSGLRLSVIRSIASRRMTCACADHEMQAASASARVSEAQISDCDFIPVAKSV